MRTSVLTAALLLSAVAAHAQPYSQQGYGQGGPTSSNRGAPPSDRGYEPTDQGGPPAPLDLRRALRLRPDQEAAYRAYQAQTAPDPRAEARMQADAQRLPSMTTPERLDLIVRQMQRDQADFAARSNAVRRFYAQLTPPQQRAFDQATAPPEPGRDGEGGGSPGPSQGYPQGDGRDGYGPPDGTPR